MSAENEQQKQESLVEIPILVPQSTQENGQENTTESTTDIKLEFQDLEYNSTTQKDPIDLPNEPIISEISLENPQQDREPLVQKSTTDQQSHARIWNIEYYQPYFNVDTVDVISRAMKSVLPFKPDFLKVIRPNPDLWGPFWIVTTCVVAFAITSNLGAFLDPTYSSEQEFAKLMKYILVEAFQKGSIGACVIYSYTFAIPLFLWMFTAYKGVNLTYIETVCIYGYSFFITIPVSLFCVLNFSWLKWILLIACFLYSSAFIVLNMLGEWKEKLTGGDKMFIFILAGSIVALQLIMAIFVRVYFYTYWSLISY